MRNLGEALAEEEALEAGETLAIVGAHLSEEPMGLAAAAGTPKADRGGTVREVTEAGSGAGSELFGLKDDAGMDEVEHLLKGAAGEPRGSGEMIDFSHSVTRGLSLLTSAATRERLRPRVSAILGGVVR